MYHLVECNFLMVKKSHFQLSTPMNLESQTAHSHNGAYVMKIAYLQNHTL